MVEECKKEIKDKIGKIGKMYNEISNGNCKDRKNEIRELMQ